jgi:hypothetical protein
LLSFVGNQFKIIPNSVQECVELGAVKIMDLIYLRFSAESARQLEMIKESKCLEHLLFDRCEWEDESFLIDLLEGQLFLSHLSVGKVSGATTFGGRCFGGKVFLALIDLLHENHLHWTLLFLEIMSITELHLQPNRYSRGFGLVGVNAKVSFYGHCKSIPLLNWTSTFFPCCFKWHDQGKENHELKISMINAKIRLPRAAGDSLNMSQGILKTAKSIETIDPQEINTFRVLRLFSTFQVEMSVYTAMYSILASFSLTESVQYEILSQSMLHDMMVIR